MNREVDDYQLDVRFGAWLRERRASVGLSIEQAARETGLEAGRLRAIEIGYAERGIHPDEAARLARVYRIALDDLLAEAMKE